MALFCVPLWLTSNVMELDFDPTGTIPTRPIGLVIGRNGIQLKIVEHMSCLGCYFYRPLAVDFCTRSYRYNDSARGGLSWETVTGFGACSKWGRTDKKTIIFKRIKDAE